MARMVRAGRFDKVITLQRVLPKSNNYGSVKRDWEDVKTIRASIEPLTLGSSRKPHAHRTALHSAYLYYCERMGIINPLQRNRFRQAFEYALKERGSKNRLLTRLKDGLTLTNIYYINIDHSLKDWDS